MNEEFIADFTNIVTEYCLIKSHFPCEDYQYEYECQGLELRVFPWTNNSAVIAIEFQSSDGSKMQIAKHYESVSGKINPRFKQDLVAFVSFKN